MNFFFRITRFPRSAFLALFLAAGAAQASQFLDVIEPGTEVYQLLKTAAAADGASGWAAGQLKNNLDLPQASARDLCQELLESPRVEEALKQKLKAALPSEAQQVRDKLSPLETEAEQIKSKMTELNTVITQIMETKKKNLYSPATNPQMKVLYFIHYGYSEVSGASSKAGPNDMGPSLMIQLNQAYTNASLFITLILLRDSTAQGIEIMHPGAYLSIQQAGQQWYNDPIWHHSFGVGNCVGDINLTLTLDPEWFHSLKISVGGNTGMLDPLICSGRQGSQGSPMTSYAQNPFFTNQVLSWSGDTIEDTALLAGTRSFQGFALEKAGTQGWWIFDLAKLWIQPSYSSATGSPNQVDTTFGGMNVAAARLDLTHRNIWPLQDSDIWLSCLLDQVETDFANPPTAANLPRAMFDRDFSLGFSSVFGEGGLFSAEIARTDWYSQGPQPTGLYSNELSWQDLGYTLKASKTIMPFSFVLDYGQLGPNFVVGPRNGLWTTNGMFGGFLDSTVDDPRPSGNGTKPLQRIAWQTMDWDSQNLVNNCRRVSLNGTFTAGWGSVTVNPGFITQLEPTGPWIQTGMYLGNNWVHGLDWFNAFWSNCVVPPGAAAPNPDYGPITYISSYTYGGAPATRPLYHGLPVNLRYQNIVNSPQGAFNGSAAQGWNWQDIQTVGLPAVIENILLSQNGLGDQNLREDSIKTVNFLKVSGSLDLQAILHTEWPLGLVGDAELRDVAEQLGMAAYSDQNLLSQQITEANFTIGLNKIFTFQGYSGYETWLSKAGYFPLEANDFVWGAGLDVSLGAFLPGASFTFRDKFMSHRDLNYTRRNWDGYQVQGQMQVTF